MAVLLSQRPFLALFIKKIAFQKMSQFFKFMFASCLGTALALVLLSFIGFCTISGAASALSSKKVAIEPNSVLEIDFKKPLPEKTNNLEMGFTLDDDKTLGLHDLIWTIREAKKDDNIKGIYLNNVMDFPAGRASASAIRRELVDFRASGKFIVAWSSLLMQDAYGIASVADSVFLNPSGMIDFRGFAAIVPFYKNLLDKLDVDMQIYYAGKFKGATEPLRLEKFSAENRLQIDEYLEAMYDEYLAEIASSRGVSKEELRRIASDFQVREPEDAVKMRLIDAVGFEDRAISAMKTRLGLNEKDKLRKITATDFFETKGGKTSDFSAKDKIAVVIAEGTIGFGEGDAGEITDEKYVPMLRKIRADEKNKALVLRVNSGGGAAISSDMILRELDLFRASGRPVIVSMGDVAASGGYLIACHADSIFAEPNTLTGSIGVFMAFPHLGRTMRENLGITFDTIKTGRFSASLTNVLSYSDEEKKIMQDFTDRTYSDFLNSVASGRKKTKEQIHEIAQGRVWTGRKAKTLGLVDELGDLDRAISSAAKMAGLEKWRTSEFPRTKDPFEQILDKVMKKKGAEDEARATLLKSELGPFFEHYRRLEDLQKMSGKPQMRLPFELESR